MSTACGADNGVSKVVTVPSDPGSEILPRAADRERRSCTTGHSWVQACRWALGRSGRHPYGAPVTVRLALEARRRAVEALRPEYLAAGRAAEVDAYVERLPWDGRWPFEETAG